MNQSEPSDDKILTVLKNVAVEQALAGKQSEDIERAVSVIKAITDRAKTEIDNRNAPQTLRWEGWKTYATAVVPLLTLATLAFTVYTQNEQLKTAQQANSDLAWRETAKNVLAQLTPTGSRTRRTVPSSSVVAVSDADAQLALELLRPYLADAKYGAEALDLGLLILIRTRDTRALNDFLDSPNTEIGSHNVDHVLGKMREIRSAFDFFDSMNKNASAPTVPPGTSPVPPPLGASPLVPPPDSPVPNYDTLLEFLTTLGNKVAEVLRTRDSATSPLNLRRVYFYQSNLQSADLVKTRLDAARFENTDLTNATIIDPLGNIESSEWVASNWWDAKAIDGKLLKYMMREYYPYPGPGVVYLKDPPSQVDYVVKVRRLCKNAGIVCSDSEFKYGTKPEPEKPSQ
jgi:hypothetical protein